RIHRNASHHQSPQHLTWTSLERLRQEIERHREANGKLPGSLADLELVKKTYVPVNEAGQPLDAWTRPFHYRVKADDYVLCSYGEDGQPGGDGPDTDLFAGEPDPWTDVATFSDFVTRPAHIPVHLACLLAGLITLPLCWLHARGE